MVTVLPAKDSILAACDRTPETSVAEAKAIAEQGWTTAHFWLTAMNNHEQGEQREAEQ